MGLWPGGLLAFHGETKIGDNVNMKVGSLLPPNYQACCPSRATRGSPRSRSSTSCRRSPSNSCRSGKIDGTQLADQNAFASNHRTQFMNAGLRINPVLFYGVPYTTMVAGAVWLPTKWLQVVTAVADNDQDGAATMTGFNTAFHGRDWYTVTQEYDITWKPFDKTGHQRLGWFWTSRDFAEIGGDGRIQFPQVIGPRVWPRQLLPRRARSFGSATRCTALASLTLPPTHGGSITTSTSTCSPRRRSRARASASLADSATAETPTSSRSSTASVSAAKARSRCATVTRGVWGYYYANINDDVDPAFGLNSEQASRRTTTSKSPRGATSRRICR